MTQKTVKEVVQNQFTGQIAVEYSDDTSKEFNIDQLPVAKVVSGNVVLEVFGETLDIAGSASSAVSQAVAQAQVLASSAVTQAQAIATITGDYVVGETLTVSLPEGWSGTYQWVRDGVDISGETAATYVLDAADEDTVVSCKVSSLTYTPAGDTVVAATP